MGPTSDVLALPVASDLQGRRSDEILARTYLLLSVRYQSLATFAGSHGRHVPAKRNVSVSRATFSVVLRNTGQKDVISQHMMMELRSARIFCGRCRGAVNCCDDA